jgi:ABC-type bacteriocin/lantibiotic exporter with double-glycine peptidase domain
MYKFFKLLEADEKKKISLLVFFIVILGVAESATFFLLQPIFNYFNTGQFDVQIPLLKFFFKYLNLDIFFLLEVFIFFFSVRFFLSIFVSYRKNILVRNINNSLSNKLFYNYIFKDYQFYINNSNSKFIADISLEVEKFSYRVVDFFISLITEFFLILGVLTFLFIVYFYLSLIFSVISLLVFFVIYNFYKNKFRNIGNVKVQNDSDKVDILYSSFYIIQNIKLDSLENYFINKFKKSTENSSRSHFLLSFLTELPKPIIEFFVLVLVLVSIFFLYSHFNMKKQDILAILIIFGVAMFRILPSFNRIFAYLNQLKFYSPTIDVLLDVFKNRINSDISNIEHSKYLGFQKNIIFNSVSFKYDGSDHYTLKDVNLTINKNEIVGISGPSGSGKSTILNLICSLLKPTSGRILVDGVSLENMQKFFKYKIGYVPQKIYLINETIVDNIILGKDKKDYDYRLLYEIINVCGLDKIINNIKNPDEFLIGERGGRLSGGQQQRIGIARALYKKPDILILDEATNALDEKAEKDILDIIFNLKKKLTIILVSHKESILGAADKIYEIKDNNIHQIK